MASASEPGQATCRPRRAKREYASGQDGLHTWPEDEQRSPKGKKHWALCWEVKPHGSRSSCLSEARRRALLSMPKCRA